MSTFNPTVKNASEIAAEHQAKQEAATVAAAKKTEQDLKMTGVEFNEVMCSAHKEDQWGLSSIESHVLAGNEVSFYFKNGSVLTLNDQNWQAFRAVWVPFRQQFFQAEES